MLSRAAIRATSSTTSLVASRRAFSTTRAQMSSPYHYPEGPRSNIPFNPLTKFFALRYWSLMAVGFGTSPTTIHGWLRLISPKLLLSDLRFGRHTRTSKGHGLLQLEGCCTVIKLAGSIGIPGNRLLKTFIFAVPLLNLLM